MKRIAAAIRNFFLPPADAKVFRRILPLFSIVILMLILFVAATVAWEESNSVAFCGLTCHTMPPEYVTHQFSPHTNVTCEDCHMGRDRLAILAGRKISYSWQTGTAMLTGNYEFPIIAKNMAPAREACENCHKPEYFVNDTLREIRNYATDENNSRTSTYLSIKTGGGSQREGLGFGIHWHIENPVYYYAIPREEATQPFDQEIPYVVAELPDGSRVEYVDVESGFDPATIAGVELKQMDCITCHNRTAHFIPNPDDLIDSLMMRGLISEEIPDIKAQSLEVMGKHYESEDEAMQNIGGLAGYYQTQRADVYAANTEAINQAISSLQDAWRRTNFPDQEYNWSTHDNNLAHKDTPGCFRCHDGKHLSSAGEAVRLECNLCHSIPVVSGGEQMTALMELSKGFEPESHKNSNWITLHRDIFDDTCAGCHTVEDPGGVSNTSFCSNSACHGATWEFAGFDAPALRAALAEQARLYQTPTPLPTEEPPAGSGQAQPTATPAAAEAAGPVTYASLQPTFKAKCGACHGAAAMKGLNVMTYADLMKGGDSGPSVVAGDPEGSLLVKVQQGAHPGKFSAAELEKVIQWIKEGAVEK